MNFNIGDSSYISSSNSSSLSNGENDNDFVDVQEQVITRICSSRNLLIVEYANQHINWWAHGGSIPSRRNINRDRERADVNLFNDYYFKNPGYNEQIVSSTISNVLEFIHRNTNDSGSSWQLFCAKARWAR